MRLQFAQYIIFLFSLICSDHFTCNAGYAPFNSYFRPLWGGNHLSVIDGGKEVQIILDRFNGGGFTSNQAYKYGVFKLWMKIPKFANGVATTFYLTSKPSNTGAHCELDFELLGRDKPPYTLNTNVFAQDGGHREQQLKLWFDPTSGFHEYKFLWNQHLIVFFIDGVPVRVFKNLVKVGAKYPEEAMYLHGSVWNGTQWLGATDWSKAPFYANYRGFWIEGCGGKSECSRTTDLTPQQYAMYRKLDFSYNYCNTPQKLPECNFH